MKSPIVSKPKKVLKSTQTKPVVLATSWANTRDTTKKVQEVEKSKGKRTKTTTQEDESKKSLRRKYIAPAKTNKDRKKSDDNSQFKVVIHSSSSNSRQLV